MNKKDTPNRLRYCQKQAQNFSELNDQLESAICSVKTALSKEKLKILEESNKILFGISENFHQQATRIANNLIVKK